MLCLLLLGTRSPTFAQPASDASLTADSSAARITSGGGGGAGGEAGSEVTLYVDRAGIGWGGYVRPGSWTPVLIELDLPGRDPRKLRLQWITSDADGDVVLWQRVVTANPSRRERYWLYAVPPLSTTPRTNWRVLAIDDASGRLLGSLDLPIPELMPTRDALIAILGRAEMGLKPFEEIFTQQEQIHYLRGLLPDRLPDRWYGYDLLELLIWAPDGGDPADPKASPRALKALRAWIERGGHLVVSLPSVGQSWTLSPLRDLLPAVDLEPVTNAFPPVALGAAIGSTFDNIDYLRLRPRDNEDGARVSVLLRDSADEHGAPLAVSHQVGLGRVTLVGVDLSDRRLQRMKLPNGRQFWHALLGWRSPALPPHEVERRQKDGKLQPLTMREPLELGGFIAESISMRGTVSALLVLTLMALGVYWLVAGPGAFWTLKARQRVHWAWVVFSVLVLCFSVVTWGGAALLRPQENRLEHFSVVDFDAHSGRMRTHSWLALLMVRHGPVRLQLPSGAEQPPNALAAPGFATSASEGGYLDPQRYIVDVAGPDDIEPPFRSTVRELELDWQGRTVDAQQPALAGWTGPQGALQVDETGWPRASLRHALPGTLRDVVVVFCPGDGAEPWVWRQRSDWPAQQPLLISRQSAQAGGVMPLVREAAPDKWDGYLWKLMGNEPLNRSAKAQQQQQLPDEPLRPRSGREEVRTSVELLTFYGTLPPPMYWKEMSKWGDGATHYMRSLGRQLNLGRLLQQRCVIVMGWLADAPLPAPLQVSGRSLPSQGWTVVRWIAPVPRMALSVGPAEAAPQTGGN